MNKVPPSSRLTNPIERLIAPVKAPRSWPKSSLRRSSRVRSAQLSVSNGRSRRRLRRWTARAPPCLWWTCLTAELGTILTTLQRPETKEFPEFRATSRTNQRPRTRENHPHKDSRPNWARLRMPFAVSRQILLAGESDLCHSSDHAPKEQT